MYCSKDLDGRLKKITDAKSCEFWKGIINTFWFHFIAKHILIDVECYIFNERLSDWDLQANKFEVFQLNSKLANIYHIDRENKEPTYRSFYLKFFHC